LIVEPVDIHGILHLSIGGDVAHAEAEYLRSGIRDATREVFNDLIWDFSNVGTIAPRAFGVLVFYFSRAILDNARPVVVDPRMELLGACYTAGLEQSIEFVRNLDEAFAYYLEGLKVNYNRLFCQLLLNEKYLTSKQLQEALVEYNRRNKTIPFGRILINLGMLGPREVIKVITTQRSYLGEILVEQNIITRQKLDEILKEQQAKGGSEKLGDLLQRLGLASNKDIYEAVHTQFKRRRQLRA
jgi:hypothetical protein